MSDLIERLVDQRDTYRSHQEHYWADTLAEAVHALERYYAMLDRREYAVARPASMPDMSGRERYTLIVGATFPTWEQADNARRRVPALRDSPTVIVSRIAPGSDWGEDDDQ
ncbi:hypothetical protein EG850_11060 [Gulosibacter macacae]|uniref:Uncharacterized protein n=1 Tax=Gulosibacter macacae TaxID=2488791 RepID=A0A3P3VUB2_9MICO|nr:hypothetical protein [Gulosibacter macacae]RRJ85917.1 hypothetical protein EG850_11060 [Gulosibacter macacae]